MSNTEKPRAVFNGTCEYCDMEEIVTQFPHLGLNVCADCYRLHKDAIDAAEAKYEKVFLGFYTAKACILGGYRLDCSYRPRERARKC